MEITLQEFQLIETEMLKEVSEICDRHSIDYCLAYGSVLGCIRHQGPIPWDLDIDIIVPYSHLQKFITIVRLELSERFFLDFHDINKYYTATFPRVGLKGYSTVNLHLDVFITCAAPNTVNEQQKFLKKCYRLRKMHFYKLVNEKYRGPISLKSKLKNELFRFLLFPFSLTWIRNKFYKLCDYYPLDKSNFLVNPGGSYGIKEVIPKSMIGKTAIGNYSGFNVRIPVNSHDYLRHMYNDYMVLPPEDKRSVKQYYSLIKFTI